MDSGIFALAIIGNVCNFAYNVPFVYVVVKHMNADNISKKFLCLRVVSSVVWIMYSIFTLEMYVGISYTISLVSSSIVLYIKLIQKKEIVNINPEKSPEYLKQTFI